MIPISSLVEKTYSALTLLGDTRLLARRGIKLLIEPDGVAWIMVSSVEVCYHPDEQGWLVCGLGGGGHLPLLDALSKAEEVALRIRNLGPSSRVLFAALDLAPTAGGRQ